MPYGHFTSMPGQVSVDFSKIFTQNMVNVNSGAMFTVEYSGKSGFTTVPEMPAARPDEF